jgi:dihydroflavonol-4-reductase
VSPGRRAFVSGATGFIGRRLAPLLTQHGYQLNCLVRPTSDTRALQSLGADLVEGDVADAAALDRGLRGADVAYHLAGSYDIGTVDAAAMRHANVEGTRAFLAALERAGTPRAVYASTTLALGPIARGLGDEASRSDGRYRSIYEHTKVEAHRLALEAQRGGKPLIIVCPAFVYGPGDKGPAGRFIADLLHGRVPGLLRQPAWFSFVHVDDVARGFVLAGERGRTGEAYVLSGESCDMNTFAARVCALASKRPPRLRFPNGLARLTGLALDPISRLTPLRFVITREGVDTTGRLRWLHSAEKAKRELGWQARGLAEGLVGTVESVEGSKVNGSKAPPSP